MAQNIDKYNEILNRILNISQYDIVRHKIMSEFYSKNDFREKAERSKWVNEVNKEQKPNGSWGRFHSQDSNVKQKYSTTENAILRLKYLAMGRGNNIIDKACNYMEELLSDLSLWPDAWEKNKWFKLAVPLFIASKLTMFGSNHPNFIKVCEIWVKILRSSFASNNYNGKDTDLIAQEYIGVQIEGSYIGLNSINNILLFSYNTNLIPVEIQMKYIKWLHYNPNNICYTSISLNNNLNELSGNKLYDYLRIMTLLSKFKGYADEFSHEIKWLENQCGNDGYWDFGNKINNNLKLSDNWRLEMNRKMDHTIFVLSVFFTAIKN